MKFSDRSAAERTAIDAWIRVAVEVREKACMKVPEGFKKTQQESISEGLGDIGKMQRFYAAYRGSGQSVSYTQYFQVANPEEYAAILFYERTQPFSGAAPA